MEDKKIFDDFQYVDCNDCSHYWDDTCEGVKKGSEKRCTAFKATRRVDIPEQIKALRNDIKWVYMAFFVETILLLLAIGSGLFG